MTGASRPSGVGGASLKGRVAIVTGAASGIGAATARRFAEARAHVAVVDVDDPGARRVVAALHDQGWSASAHAVDIGDRDRVAQLVDEVSSEHGRLDVLVNNAGVYAFSPLEAVTEAEFRRQFDTNVLGLIVATREAAARFGAEGGSVINIGSVVSRIAPPASVIYTATKGAVDAVTHVLAKELGPRKIRVNSINPGGVETEGTHAAGIIGSDFEQQMIAQTPLGRLGQPGDIAPIAVFLASADAGWLTGETLLAGGGTR